MTVVDLDTHRREKIGGRETHMHEWPGSLEISGPNALRGMFAAIDSIRAEDRVR